MYELALRIICGFPSFCLVTIVRYFCQGDPHISEGKGQMANTSYTLSVAPYSYLHHISHGFHPGALGPRLSK